MCARVGILVRRGSWTLSVRSFLLIFLATTIIAVAFLHVLYPFLAITERVPTRILVLDGWLPTYDLNKAAATYLTGNYQQLLAVSAAYEFQNIDQDPGNAYVVTHILVRDGVPPDQVNPVIFLGMKVDRTFYSAIAVKAWCSQHGIPLQSLDIATLGPHARRSRLLYQKALGNGIKIGVIALDDPAYDSRHWWRSSEGVREVLFEFVAYIYVRLFFWAPPANELHLLPASE
jgi:hypothetical protein